MTEPHDINAESSLLATLQARIALRKKQTGKPYKKASEDGGLQKDYIRLTLRQNSMPSAERLGRIAQGYETTVAFLTGATDDPEPPKRKPDVDDDDLPAVEASQDKVRLHFNRVVSHDTALRILGLLEENRDDTPSLGKRGPQQPVAAQTVGDVPGTREIESLETLRSEFWRQVEARRKERGYSLDGLSQAAGFSSGLLKNHKAKKALNMRIDSVVGIAKALECTLPELFGYQATKPTADARTDEPVDGLPAVEISQDNVGLHFNRVVCRDTALQVLRLLKEDRGA